jgi:uncharacterized protein (DUF2062 family)
MSSLTTTLINTANGSTNLTLGTGNTSGPALVVSSGSGVTIRANATSNVFVANSSTIAANVAMTVANTLTATTINATSFNLGTPSIATSGHSRLPNGLLVQWGTVSVNSTTGSITFPTAFAASPYSLQITATATGNTEQAAVTAITTTTASVRSSRETTAATQYYLALGV